MDKTNMKEQPGFLSYFTHTLSTVLFGGTRGERGVGGRRGDGVSKRKRAELFACSSTFTEPGNPVAAALGFHKRQPAIMRGLEPKPKSNRKLWITSSTRTLRCSFVQNV